ncbi:serine protease gd-like [Anthonomus grandis grandis]|uniref:serine protease gd-like n=1 Tax=Anthonomus grandis grandis TaxID=2921223 RepID=UPI002165E16D|nr:serine protease gd-like [Anthonomus grandis grandis]XP_050308709.1 serine protease gd-like [Anthonomus grandis grandis]
MLINLIIVHALIISIVHGELLSPCPDIFRYEQAKDPDILDRWYGVITVSTDDDLEGIYLKITLDKRADLLGNWFAEAQSEDNVQFSIKNPKYKLEAGPPILVRFFVKYNPYSSVPVVKRILLNGKTICPSNREKPTEPTLHISEVLPPKKVEPSYDNEYHSSNETTTSSNKRPAVNRPNSTTRRPSVQPTAEPSSFNRPLSVLQPNGFDDGEFFHGDFQFPTKRTTSRPLNNVQRTPVECGTISIQRATPLISHGENTVPGQWPWHTALYLENNKDTEYICGGTLVSDKHVITAAHCVTKTRTNVPVQPNRLIMYFGKYNRLSFGADVQERNVESIKVHPSFNASVYYNDIAVVTLASPVEFTNFVRPCCLWDDKDVNIENLVGKRGLVVGWGFDQTGQLSKNLMQSELPIVSTKTCLFSNRNFFSQFTSDKNFCAGFRNETAVCNGDSGGGMTFPKPTQGGTNVVWQLRGVISLGVARQSGGVCDPKEYSLLTDVAQYLRWIKDIMRE